MPHITKNAAGRLDFVYKKMIKTVTKNGRDTVTIQ